MRLRGGPTGKANGDYVSVDTSEPKDVDYSPIKHLAQALTLSAEWGQVLFAMTNWIGVFDAAGKEEQERIVVAGFVSTAERWINFEKLWFDRLKKDNIEYFHMVDFAHSRGQFKDGWKGDEVRRQALFSDLIEIIEAHAFRKFGHVVKTAEMVKGLTKRQCEQHLLKAYSLAGLGCAVDIFRWRKTDGIAQQVIMVFEDGDSGKGKLLDLLVRWGFPAPTFQPKKDRQTESGLLPGIGALQAADLFAYEAFRFTKDMERESANRWGWQELSSIPGFVGIHEGFQDFEKLGKGLDLVTKLESWWSGFNKI